MGTSERCELRRFRQDAQHGYEVVAALHNEAALRDHRINALLSRQGGVLYDAVERHFGAAAEHREHRLFPPEIHGIVPPFPFGHFGAIEAKDGLKFTPIKRHALLRFLHWPLLCIIAPDCGTSATGPEKNYVFRRLVQLITTLVYDALMTLSTMKMDWMMWLGKVRLQKSPFRRNCIKLPPWFRIINLELPLEARLVLSIGKKTQPPSRPELA
jgi:hypothetical protein